MLKKRRLVILCLLSLSSLSVGAFSLEGIEGRIGGYWYGNGNPDPYTPSPLLMSIGAALPYRISGNLLFYPDISFTFMDYLWEATEARAVPAEIATRDHVSVLQVLINPSLVLLYDLNEKIALGGHFAATLFLRFPLAGADEGNETRDELFSYFFKAGRFFYPSLGPRMRWRFSDSMSCNLSAQLSWPLHHLWDGEGLPLWDQMIVTGSLGLLFHF